MTIGDVIEEHGGNAAFSQTLNTKRDKKMTKTQAIKHARNSISSLSFMGGGYYFTIWDEDFNAWRQGISRDYYAAQWARSQALIDAARDVMGLECVDYAGGSWTDYV